LWNGKKEKRKERIEKTRKGDHRVSQKREKKELQGKREIGRKVGTNISS